MMTVLIIVVVIGLVVGVRNEFKEQRRVSRMARELQDARSRREEGMSALNILELMKHQDQIADSFHTLLLNCPFCGKRLTTEELKGYGGKPRISCACGASMGYDLGILELLAHWNRRDGVDFSLEAEYTQRLITAQSELAEYKRMVMEEFNRQRKAIEAATARAINAETELAQYIGKGEA